MVDVFSKEKRSVVMRQIRSTNNEGTELLLIQIFRAYGITGWRRGSKLLGKPDFVFPKLRLAVFVDGCFWHGCPRHGTQPKTNVVFWRAKIARNRERDREVGRLLRAKGWRVMRIWEHELKRRDEPKLARRLLRVLSVSV